MMSRNSCSKGLVRDCMRRNLWAIVLSTVGFFMAQLLPVIMTAQHSLSAHKQDLVNMNAADAAASWQGYVESVGQMLGGQNPFAKMAVIILAVTCGVSMFAYLHNRRKVDFYHSLPISRSRLFAVNYAAGALCALVPYLVLHVLSIVSACAMGFGEAVDASLIGVIVSNVIFFFLLYAMAAVTTILCGNTVITLLLGLWVYFGPTLVTALWQGLKSMFFETYVADVSMTSLLFCNKFAPLIQYFGVNGAKMSSSAVSTYTVNYTGLQAANEVAPSAIGLLIGYAIAAVVITALALFLFRIRKSERAGTALAFNPIKLPIKIIICAVMGTAFAEILKMLAYDTKLWFWVGLVLGTVIFHCVVEIIYAFDFRAIFRKPLQLVIILAVLCAGLLTMQFDVFGYDKWLPNEDSIAAAAPTDYTVNDSVLLSEPENIAATRQLAVLGVESLNSTDENAPTNYMTISFKMKNGSVKTRAYNLQSTDEVLALEKQIFQSAEYKQKAWTLFTLGDINEGYHRNIDFYTNGDGYNCVGTLSDPQKVQEIIDTLKAETLTHTGDAMPVLRMEFSQQGDNEAMNSDYYSEGGVCVTEKDVKTLALIKKYANVEPKPLSAANVKAATLSIYLPDKDYWQGVQVTDKADINALLQNAVNIDALNLYGSDAMAYGIASRYDRGGVTVTYKAENGDEWDASVGYTEEDYPSAIIEKYRAQAEKDAANGGTQSAQVGDVGYTMETAVG